MTPKLTPLRHLLNTFHPDQYADDLPLEAGVVWCVPEAKDFPFVRQSDWRGGVIAKPRPGDGSIVVAYTTLVDSAAIRARYSKPLRRYWHVNPSDVERFDDARDRNGELDLSQWDPEECPVEGAWPDSIQEGVPALPAYHMLLALSAEAGNYEGKRDIAAYWAEDIAPIYEHLRRVKKEYRQSA